MKKKRTYSRRRKALFWLTMLAAAVVVVVLIDGYHFLPSQTLDYIEDREALEELEIIHTERGKYEPLENSMLIVSRNRDFVALSVPRFDLNYGWGSSNAAIIPLDEEGGHHAWEAGTMESDEKWVCLFGFVPAGEETPTFRIISEDFEAAHMEELLTVTPTPTIPTTGGMLFLEQYGFTLRAVEEGNHVELNVEVRKDGEWVTPDRWTVSSYS